MVEHFLIDHGKLVGSIIVFAATGGVFAAVTGRAFLRKWLLNGTEETLKEVKALLLEKIEKVDEAASEAADHACPVLEKGGTPFTLEAHEKICATQRELAQKDNKLLMVEMGHLKSGQERTDRKLTRILLRLYEPREARDTEIE